MLKKIVFAQIISTKTVENKMSTADHKVTNFTSEIITDDKDSLELHLENLKQNFPQVFGHIYKYCYMY
jgi:hypothetical protein